VAVVVGHTGVVAQPIQAELEDQVMAVMVDKETLIQDNLV
jgi:hypothetical protein